MRSLILRDLRLNRNALLVNAGLFAALLAYMIWRLGIPTQVIAVFSALMFSFSPMSIVVREDRFRTLAFTCSLPLTRRTYVRAKYVGAMTMAGGGVVFVMTLGAILPARLPLHEILSPTVWLTAFTICLVVVSLMLPFTLRFGAAGLFIFLIGTQVLGVVLLLVVRMTGSSADKALVRSILRALGDARAWLGPAGFGIAWAAALLALVGASYWVSVRVFERREL